VGPDEGGQRHRHDERVRVEDPLQWRLGWSVDVEQREADRVEPVLDVLEGLPPFWSQGRMVPEKKANTRTARPPTPVSHFRQPTSETLPWTQALAGWRTARRSRIEAAHAWTPHTQPSTPPIWLATTACASAGVQS
jgi:hypothetical protein